ncbi:hypothetical protein CgunFtcFv8_025287 [Champsocephalus gunnari]|uniref:Uncharacterized protein n=1 Tax=Champsocephalus gunnari TaxID=52237 RepID=A0AAN8H367_CHAGU|nr:hypothetical protein CgunFtcFv8_025287 [Champsocephalus gunnari]
MHFSNGAREEKLSASEREGFPLSSRLPPFGYIGGEAWRKEGEIQRDTSMQKVLHMLRPLNAASSSQTGEVPRRKTK